MKKKHCLGHHSTQQIDLTKESEMRSLFHVVRKINSKSLVSDFMPSSLNCLTLHSFPSETADTRPGTPANESLPVTGYAQYLLGTTLSQRQDLTVTHALSKFRLTPVVIKSYHKSLQRQMRREINILKHSTHPNIIKAFDQFRSRKHYHLVLEYVQGKTLTAHIQLHGKLPEREAKRIFRQVVSAVVYCHSRQISHQNLTTDHILVGAGGQVKLISFGHSTCSSAATRAPTDIWALGVLFWQMLTGTLPFTSLPDSDRIRKLLTNQHSGLSRDACSFLRKIFKADPTARATAQTVLEDRWLNDFFLQT